MPEREKTYRPGGEDVGQPRLGSNVGANVASLKLGGAISLPAHHATHVLVRSLGALRARPFPLLSPMSPNLPLLQRTLCSLPPTQLHPQLFSRYSPDRLPVHPTYTRTSCSAFTHYCHSPRPSRANHLVWRRILGRRRLLRETLLKPASFLPSAVRPSWSFARPALQLVLPLRKRLSRGGSFSSSCSLGFEVYLRLPLREAPTPSAYWRAPFAQPLSRACPRPPAAGRPAT